MYAAIVRSARSSSSTAEARAETVQLEYSELCTITEVNRLSQSTPFLPFLRLYHRVKRNFRHFTNSLKERQTATAVIKRRSPTA